MLRVGLTGNIASGKSTVASLWRRRGARVIDADELARQAVEPGSAALERIAQRWGPGVRLPSGELDRAALRDVVFRDPAERRALEEIVHPEVQRLRTAELEKARRERLDLVVADIPLLFEAGLEGDFDLIVLVDSPEAVRRDRLVQSRGLGTAEAQRMIDAQWPASRKRDRADVVIENDGSLADLEARADEVWRALVERAAGGGLPQ